MTTEVDEKLKKAIEALTKIAEMAPDSDEWDGAAKYTETQEIARRFLVEMNIKFYIDE